MEVKAKLSYLRIAPRKVRMVADLIRGKKVEKARAVLSFTTKKAAHPILKLLNSALASAVNTFQLQEPNLYISKIVVDGGPMLKRWRARARGRAFEIQKKTSHVTIVLDEIKETKKKVKKIKKTGKPAKKEVEKEAKTEKPKFEIKSDVKKPKGQQVGAKRFFRRKSF